VTSSIPVQLRQPRLAELVADALRQRILDGVLADGQLLPNQESLLTEFTVSKPSLREALRILEAEGLITVRRGNVGGAVVHRPQARHAAYTLALVLQARGALLADVSAALKQLEGTCAGLCAGRPDRASSVVPVLRDCNRRAAAALDDELAYVAATADFHRNLVSCCGNSTMALIVGSLESLWLGHVQTWAETTTKAGIFPSPGYRRQGLDVHEEITGLIEAGEVVAAAELAETHFDPEQFYSATLDGHRGVDASVLRAPGRTIDSVSLRAT
jgi:GntR family transcriptional regulator, transcriptional repressor for pyruvate dehydrogenase complex